MRDRIPTSSNRRKGIAPSIAWIAAAAILGCSHPTGLRPSAQAFTLDTIATDYVRLVLALGERDPDSLDFAAVSPRLREAVHQSYPTYEAIDHDTAHLLAQLNSLPIPKEQQARAQSLTHQLEAIHARIALLEGQTPGFDNEARVLFQTERLPDHSERERAALRQRILGMLPPSKRSPSEAYAAYSRRFLIPPDRLPSVMTAALGACRRQTLAHLELPANESVDLAFVGNKPWSAFSRFQGNAHSTIQINVSLPVTVDQALELACHEGYPGHHVFNTLRDIALAQKQHLPEAEVQPTFSPQSYLSESAAAYAPRLAFSESERIRVERDLLFPLAGLPPAEAGRYVTLSNLVRGLDSAEPAIARQYLDGELEFVRAAQRLEAETLMEHSEATLLYLNEYRSYMLAYTDGPRRVAAQIGEPEANGTTPAQDRSTTAWKRYKDLTETVAVGLPAPPWKRPQVLTNFLSRP